MRTIAHISDLHFGRVNCAVLPALREAIAACRPDIVAVSGDLTQRAKPSEFAAAKNFLATLPSPQIVVPGNHDVPLYNLWMRWRHPLKNYRRYIARDLEPFFADNEIAVLGINTARSMTFKNGRINTRQAAGSCNLLSQVPASCRILVAHHPFDVETSAHHDTVVGRAEMAMGEFARCRVDLILTGHLHASRTGTSSERYRGAGYDCLFIQAGTASSSRQRGEGNAWNLIQIEKDRITVRRMVSRSNDAPFCAEKVEHFIRSADGWKPDQNPDAMGTTRE